MKYFRKALIIIGCLLLAGCADASATVKNGSSAIITVGGKKVTKEQVYELLRAQNDSSTALNIIKTYICDKEVETTDDITTTAQASLQKAKDNYGEDFDTYLSYYGYTDENDYYTNVCLTDAKYAELTDTYVNENWDALLDTYWPSQVQILETEDADAATSALTQLKAGADFATLAASISTKSDTLFDGTIQVVSSNDSDTLPTFVQDFIKETNQAELSGVIQNDSGDKFYIVNLISKDALSYKKDAVAEIETSTTLETEMMAYYYKKYNFHTYDKTLRDYLETNYPTYLNQ